MKKLFSLSYMMLLAALVASSFFLSSCGDNGDDVEPPPILPKLDGLYVFGTNTVAAGATDPEARLALAVLDPGKGAEVESMDSVYGKFMYIGANSTISFMKVVGTTATTFGAENGGTVTLGTDVGNVLINDNVVHGTLLKDGPAIKIEDEGLYYVFLNKLEDLFVIMPVKPDMIGDATAAQWAAGTPIPVKSVSKAGAVFEATNVALYDAHGYRYRFNDGWHTYNDENIITLSSLGVLSYGDSWATGINDLGFFLDNIPHKVDGLYTVALEFNYATGKWTETKTKTGNFVIDYSEYQMGLMGNAYPLAEGDPWTNGTGYGLHVPVKAGNIYTWTWENAELHQDKEFIFLQDGIWEGRFAVDYSGATNGGPAVTDGKIVDATTKGALYHNYFVVEDGYYDITLTINAETGVKTTSITKTGNLLIDYSDYQMGLFGNAYEISPGVEANWGSGTDGYGLHAPVKAGNVYTWTWENVNLIQDREFIFLQNGAWGGLQIDYTGATNGGAAIDGGKIVDATTKDGAYHNYYVVEVGSYTISLTINAETAARTISFVKN